MVFETLNFNYMYKLILIPFTALVISFITLGFRVITSKVMLLYFLREPFDKLEAKRARFFSLNRVFKNKITASADEYNQFTKEMHDLNYKPKRTSVILYLGKPLILCATCMASVHTLIWFPYFTGEYNWNIIPVMLTSAFINAYLFKKYRG